MAILSNNKASSKNTTAVNDQPIPSSSSGAVLSSSPSSSAPSLSSSPRHRVSGFFGVGRSEQQQKLVSSPSPSPSPSATEATKEFTSTVMTSTSLESSTMITPDIGSIASRGSEKSSSFRRLIPSTSAGAPSGGSNVANNKPALSSSSSSYPDIRPSNGTIDNNNNSPTPQIQAGVSPIVIESKKEVIVNGLGLSSPGQELVSSSASSWYSWAWSPARQENVQTLQSEPQSPKVVAAASESPVSAPQGDISKKNEIQGLGLNISSGSQSTTKPTSVENLSQEQQSQHEEQPSQPQQSSPAESWYSSLFYFIGATTRKADQHQHEHQQGDTVILGDKQRDEIIVTGNHNSHNLSSTPSPSSDAESVKDPNAARSAEDRPWGSWFYSNKPTNNSALPEGRRELAVTDTSNQANLRKVKRTERSGSPHADSIAAAAATIERQKSELESKKPAESTKPNGSGKVTDLNKQTKHVSSDSNKQTKQDASSDSNKQTKQHTSSGTSNRTVSPEPIEPVSKKPRKSTRPNIVTPSLDESFPLYTQSVRIKASLEKFSQYLMPSLKDASKTQFHDSLYRCAPHKVHKVVVVGVHGYFPARVVRTFLGEPTGTSVKFANEAALAVERWADEKGYTIEVEKIALEGEGKVLKRVETLYQLLNNWMHLIHEADFIYFAAHSQGTPVAVHLLAKLVEEGHVENKRIALLGMAGVSLGPMSGLDQKLLMRAITSIESDSLLELFEFQKPDSFQSRKYLESLRAIIAHNAKVVFVGSLDDQLIPLYSSTCSHIAHPNIYRAVYIDGEDVAPEFVSNLLSIALRLRNIGSTDHGLVRELSGSLAGAITGKGHSKVYNEPLVYDLTVRYALETIDGGSKVPVKVSSSFEIPKPNHNPYLLPWSMSGLINEAVKRSTFIEKINDLYDEFDSWKPESKVLKDVKYRLSAIQAKL